MTLLRTYKCKILTLFALMFLQSCVVITFKEQHNHIHHNSEAVKNRADISGSDPSGNDVSPELELPLP